MYLFFSFFCCFYLSSSIRNYNYRYSFMKKPFFLSNFIYENNYETINNNNNNENYIKDKYNNTYNITQIQIHQFIEQLKLKTFEQCNEIDNWDSGEIEWEV